MQKTVIIAGTTGLVGQALLRLAVADPTVETIYSVGRRPAPFSHPKIKSMVVDFSALPPMPGAQELYLALGTTIKVAGSQAAFRSIDLDANLSLAQAAFKAGVRKVGLISAMGANARSSVFYNRVKGELEDALALMGLDALVLARPSLLLGNRLSLGQPVRRGETLGLALSKALGFLIPSNYKPIAAESVARALWTTVPLSQGRTVLVSGAMQ